MQRVLESNSTLSRIEFTGDTCSVEAKLEGLRGRITEEGKERDACRDIPILGVLYAFHESTTFESPKLTYMPRHSFSLSSSRD